MAWFRMRNTTELPVHVAISQAGVIWFYKNDLPQQGYWEANVGLGGYDLNVIPSNGSNQIDPARDNLAGIAKWAVGGAAVLSGVVGLVLIPATAGGSSALVASAAATTAGVIATVADITVSVVDHELHPATMEGLYGPDGYNFKIIGGQIVGHLDKPPQEKVFIIDKIAPIGILYHNNNTGRGTFDGALG